MVLVDLPGHGESPAPDTSSRTVAQALLAETIGLLDQIGLERPHVAGSSLGGRIALEMAVAGRAASVTAFSPAGFWRADRELNYARVVNKAMQIGGMLIRPMAPALVRSTAGRALIYAEIVSRPSRVTPQQATGDMEAFLNSKATMNAILAGAVPFTGTIPASIPVTIAWGTNDRLLPPRQALVAIERLPHARLVMLSGCGHVPMTDDPRRVADVLLDGSGIEQGHLDEPVDVGLILCSPAVQRYAGGHAACDGARSGRDRQGDHRRAAAVPELVHRPAAPSRLPAQARVGVYHVRMPDEHQHRQVVSGVAVSGAPGEVESLALRESPDSGRLRFAVHQVAG